MAIEKMTTKAQEALRTAMTLASRRGHPELHPEHICLAVLEQEGGIGRPLILRAGGEYATLVSELEDRLNRFPQVSGGGEPRFSRRTNIVLEAADDQAKAMKDDFVSTEHLLLGAAKKDREIQAAFDKAGLNLDKVMKALASIR